MVYTGYYKVMSNIPKMGQYQPLKDGDFMGFNIMSNGDLMEFINHKFDFYGIYMDLSNKHCDFMGYNQQTLDIVRI